MTLNLRS